MVKFLIIFTCAVVFVFFNLQTGYTQDLEVSQKNNEFIYRDSLAKTFEQWLPADGPEFKLLHFAPVFKPISDTIRLKQIVNHLGQQFLTDDIKRIIREENQRNEKDVFLISLRYDKLGKIISATIVIGEKLKKRITEQQIRELYTSVMCSTIGSQFLEEATIVDKAYPNATTGQLSIFLLANKYLAVARWMTVDISKIQ